MRFKQLKKVLKNFSSADQLAIMALLDRNAVPPFLKVSLNIWRFRQIWRLKNSFILNYYSLLLNKPLDISLDFSLILFPRSLVS
jgi:hypothetical protein